MTSMPNTHCSADRPGLARGRIATLLLLVTLALGWGGAWSSRTALAALPGPPGGQGLPGTFGLPNIAAPQEESSNEFNDSRDRVKATAKLNATQALPGGDVVLAVVLDIAHGWHLWPTEGAPAPKDGKDLKPMDGAILTTIAFPQDPADPNAILQPEGLIVHRGFMQLPEVHAANANGGRIPAFEGYSVFYIPITVKPDAAPGTRSITFTAGFQTCDAKTCLAPATVELHVDLEILAPGAATAAAPVDADFKAFDSTVFAKIRAGEKPPEIVKFDVFGFAFELDARGAGFILLLLVAAVGGLLLNFTPCVLPVIPLKIMGLANTAGSRGRTLWLGLMMSLGVIAFWMALGVAVSSIKGFSSANQLFQYPAVTIAIGAIIVAMAVGMMGFFSVGLPQWVYMVNPKHESAHGSFLFGIMTAVLSTPCTAPLMGAAIAWAATRDVGTVLMVFAAVGVGMAVPYGVLAAFPSLLKSMPRTGPASELIKQVMGLLLVAAGCFFLGSGFSGLMVTPPDPPSRLYWWLVAAAGIVAGGWLAYRTVRITTATGRRVLFGGLGVFIFAISIFIGVTQTSHGPIKWTYYTPERLAEAKRRGDVVVIDFTAEWCLNCKALESAVLNPSPVSKLLNTPGVTAIKVDLTGNNTHGNDLLKQFNRITIPLLVVIRSDGTEVFKSDTYQSSQVLEALKSASDGKIVAVDERDAGLTPVSNTAAPSQAAPNAPAAPGS